ncbi:MAG: hypothetical protein U0229_07320 [Anaeromyxobacter sp.]
MRTSSTLTIAALAGALSLTACFGIPSAGGIVGRITDRAVGTASDRVGDQVGNQVGNAAAAKVGATMSPYMMQFYMQFIFAMAFSQGGYSLEETPYKPGEWTRWSIPNEKASGDEAKEMTLERAYLFDEGGATWWKVKYVADPKKPAESTMIIEGLFDKKDYTLRRMRAKMPNEKEGKEMPVTQQTYYVPPQRLTPESIKGATKGIVTVTVPAGTFKARHVVFGDAAGGSVEWFLVDGIPGGNVKTIHTGAKPDDDGKADPAHYTMLLTAKGTGAASELGVTKP